MKTQHPSSGGGAFSYNDYCDDPERAAKEEAARYNALKAEPKDGIYCDLCHNREMIAHAVRGEGMFRNNWYVEHTFCSCVKKRAAQAKRKASGMEEALNSVGDFYRVRRMAADNIDEGKAVYGADGFEVFLYRRSERRGKNAHFNDYLPRAYRNWSRSALQKMGRYGR